MQVMDVRRLMSTVTQQAVLKVLSIFIYKISGHCPVQPQQWMNQQDASKNCICLLNNIIQINKK